MEEGRLPALDAPCGHDPELTVGRLGPAGQLIVRLEEEGLWPTLPFKSELSQQPVWPQHSPLLGSLRIVFQDKQQAAPLRAPGAPFGGP